MKHLLEVFILLIALLTIQAHSIVYASLDVIERHTPGFPLNMSIQNILKVIESLGKNIANTSTGAEKESVWQYLSYVSNQISDEKLRKELVNMGSKYLVNGSLSRDELAKAIQMALASNASLNDIALFLSAVNMLARASGYQNIAKLGESILAMLQNVSKETRFTSSQSSSSRSSQTALPSLLQVLESMPKPISPPPIFSESGMQLPSMLMSIDLRTVFALLVIAAITSIFIAYRNSVINAVRGFMVRKSIDSVDKNLGKMIGWQIRKAILNYWKAVTYIERVYRIRKEDWMTHREYLDSVEKRAELLSSTFKEITSLYEAARYAHETSGDVDEKSSEYLSKLVGARK